MVLPERKIESIQQFWERFPEVKEVILDGTECLVQRPQEPQKQQEHYSSTPKKAKRKRTQRRTKTGEQII
jgi:hypothetical protein